MAVPTREGIDRDMQTQAAAIGGPYEGELPDARTGRLVNRSDRKSFLAVAEALDQRAGAEVRSVDDPGRLCSERWPPDVGGLRPAVLRGPDAEQIEATVGRSGSGRSRCDHVHGAHT
jgi:hypothetical protein